MLVEDAGGEEAEEVVAAVEVEVSVFLWVAVLVRGGGLNYTFALQVGDSAVEGKVPPDFMITLEHLFLITRKLLL